MRYIFDRKHIVTNELSRKLRELFDNINKIKKKDINKFINS